MRTESVPPFGTPEWDTARHVAPDLVVEIASTNQYRPEMAAKAQIYLAAGKVLNVVRIQGFAPRVARALESRGLWRERAAPYW